eukprot:gene12548-15768_t
MASELSHLIESELKQKGFREGDQNEIEEEVNDEEAPHQALMGALRVEARVKEQQAQKKLLNLRRIICIGGGIALVLIVWLVLIAASSRKADAMSGGVNTGLPIGQPLEIFPPSPIVLTKPLRPTSPPPPLAPLEPPSIVDLSPPDNEYGNDNEHKND